MSDSTTRPKAVRTYGSKRAEVEAPDAAGPLLTRGKSSGQSDTVIRPSSPAVSSTTSSPSKGSVADPTDFFGWKSKIRDIDEGLEDDNLKNLISAENASASPTPESVHGSPSRSPSFANTATLTPMGPSSNVHRSQPLSPLAPRSRTESPSGSPARKQISSLSISSPESVFKPAASRLTEKTSPGNIASDSDDAISAPKRRLGKTKVSCAMLKRTAVRNNELTRSMNIETIKEGRARDAQNNCAYACRYVLLNGLYIARLTMSRIS